jgi:hypothetical protein
VPFSTHIAFVGDTKEAAPSLTDNVGPRFGFAWQFHPGIVLRGGYGILYDTVTGRSQYAQNNIEGAVWPYSSGITNATTNISTAGLWPGTPANPLTAITSLAGNSPNPVFATSPWLAASYVNSPNYDDARAQEYNLQLQDQLSKTIVFSIGYAGSKDDRLNFTGKVNAAQSASPAGTSATAIDALKLVPWASPAWNYSSSTGYSNYNALLVQFQKRFSTSLSSIVSYTWSKCLDNSSGFFNAENGTGGGSVVQNYFNPSNAYGVCGYNIPNYLTWSTNYTLPFGKNQKYLNSGLVSYLFGGFAINDVFQVRSGQPYNLTVGGDPANISGDNGTVTGYSRPNLVSNPKAGACGSAAFGTKTALGYCAFNAAAFAVPSGSFGNYGKGVMSSPSYNNFDFSIVKVTPIRDQFKLELRAEAFNLYNAQILAAPGTTIGTSSAGYITSIASTPRELQISAKVTF